MSSRKVRSSRFPSKIYPILKKFLKVNLIDRDNLDTVVLRVYNTSFHADRMDLFSDQLINKLIMMNSKIFEKITVPKFLQLMKKLDDAVK